MVDVWYKLFNFYHKNIRFSCGGSTFFIFRHKTTRCSPGEWLELQAIESTLCVEWRPASVVSVVFECGNAGSPLHHGGHVLPRPPLFGRVDMSQLQFCKEELITSLHF